MNNLNKYEQAIIKNADWFISLQKEEGYIDAAGDEFYGIRGDATLVGHSVTVRMYAYALTGDEKYKISAKKSLDWLAERQDARGGWKKHAGYTLDAAQCVFEGFSTYTQISGSDEYHEVMKKSAQRMTYGTIRPDGSLLLPNVIEIGEYAHFSFLAWKRTGNEEFKKAGEAILKNICQNFDENEGYWNPYDKNQPTPFLASVIRPILRWIMYIFPPKGKLLAKISGYLLPYVVVPPHPQYSMNMMDAESLLDTLDGSCEFPELKEQTKKAIVWATEHCKGPFSGTLVESKITEKKDEVYPVPIINDTKMAALWPTTCLLLAYCGLQEAQYKEKAQEIADWLVTVQDDKGGFYNFQNPDGSFHPLQSGNVNFYGSMALWIYNEVYDGGKIQLFTKKHE
ncbi:hypothetical protein HZA38_00355 [Candidatus Peregrinibacteria bacterium]|nr:hypothetical protein [Candidatus Peregrinibacteria bacterium]